MLKKITVATAILLGSSLCLEVSIHARSVYLNGQDISSARGQTLKKVNLKIDENGDLFIEGPHYQVHEETTYTPLSSYNKTKNAPPHQAAGPIAISALAKPGEQKTPSTDATSIEAPATQAPVENVAPRLQDKPGDNTGG